MPRASILEYFSHQWALAIFGVLAVILVGFTDYLTGPFLWWTIVYVLPVSAFAWLTTRGFGVFLAFLSGLSSLTANLSWQVPDRPPWAPYWNGAVVWISCLVFAVTVAKLRESVKTRERLVNMVSHDLKDVVTALGLNLELLGAGAMTDDGRRKQFEALNAAAQRMRRMVVDFAFLTSGKGKKLVLSPDQIDLGRLVTDAIALFRPSAEHKKIDLHVSTIEEPAYVRADRERIAEVLDNLLSNSIKFTPPGGVVELGLLKQGDAVEITVRDTGHGIPPSQRKRVFEAFWKGSDEQAGTGLGLFITRKIVEQHGGDIWVEPSAPGSIMHVRLPATA